MVLGQDGENPLTNPRGLLLRGTTRGDYRLSTLEITPEACPRLWPYIQPRPLPSWVPSRCLASLPQPQPHHSTHGITPLTILHLRIHLQALRSTQETTCLPLRQCTPHTSLARARAPLITPCSCTVAVSPHRSSRQHRTSYHPHYQAAIVVHLIPSHLRAYPVLYQPHRRNVRLGYTTDQAHGDLAFKCHDRA